MKSLAKIFFIIVAFFACTFLLIRFSGILSIAQIEGWLIHAERLSLFYVALVVILLLFADLLIAIPTLTVMILSGYFLGFAYGLSAVLTGILLVAICGYSLSHRYGDVFLAFLLKEKSQRDETIQTFQKHGFVMILLSRAMPILPEAVTCLAGMTRMPFRKYLLAWLISSIPYALIATYSGSISSLENPRPAIFSAIGISISLWLGWFFYRRRMISPT